MTRRLFREGGPHKITSTSPNEYSLSITIPPDDDGFRACECPNTSCSPAYFKVKPGTGIIAQEEAFCPYCRHCDKPSEFSTREQIRYAKDIVIREAHKGIDGIIEDALGLGPFRKKKMGGDFFSIEMSYKPGSLPSVQRPFEESLRREVVCPTCTLEQAVFGLATWCADCGADIFLVHVEAECQVVRKMLGDVERRREGLGARVAARDVENALEDIVSIFEAVLRALTRRKKMEDGLSESEVALLLKKVGNSFQNIERSTKLLQELFGLDLLNGIDTADSEFLKAVFEKRHPITHNLGIIDRKYLDRVRSGELEGRDVPVVPEEVEQAIEVGYQVIKNTHTQLFSAAQ